MNNISFNRAKFKHMAVQLGYSPGQADKLLAQLDRLFASSPTIKHKLDVVARAGVGSDLTELLRIVAKIVLMCAAAVVIVEGAEILAAMTLAQWTYLVLTAVAVYIVSSHPIDNAKKLFHDMLDRFKAKLDMDTIGATDIKRNLNKLA